MKLFSLKKDKATSNESNINENDTLSELDISDNKNLDSTKSAELSSNKSVIDEFALDSIDLNALEEELFKGQPTVTTSNLQPQEPFDKEFSFDDFELDNSTPELSQSSGSESLSNSTIDLDKSMNKIEENASPLNFDEFDDTSVPEVTNTHLAVESDILAAKNLSSEKHASDYVADTTINATNHHSNETDRHIVSNDDNTQSPNTQNTATQSIDKPTIVTTSKVANESTPVAESNNTLAAVPLKSEQTLISPKPVLKKSAPAKHNNKILYILLPIAALALGGWYLLNHQATEPVPVKAAAPIIKPKSKPQTASTVVASTTLASRASAPASTPTVVATVANTASTVASDASATFATITAEEILKPTLPQNPTVAKEEMDRLADQSNQLKEQEAMMEEQLRMMNELSDKKEERIKLLEQQVNLLEQKKIAGKSAATKP